MTAPAPTYDLVLLLDPQAEDAQRQKIVADVRNAISAQGELVRHDEWGSRVMAYQIDHKAAAEYHLLQFHADGRELIEGLNRTLHITDGIMRFRINKLKPGTPEAPNLANAPAPLPAAADTPPAAEPAAAVEPTPAAQSAPPAPAAEPIAPAEPAPAAEPQADAAPAGEAPAAEAEQA